MFSFFLCLCIGSLINGDIPYQMIIVKYESQHTDQLKKLFLESRQKTFYWLDTTAFNLNDFELQTQDEQLFVAIEEKTVIGFISLWLEDNFIHHLYVRESDQQKRIGSQLLDVAMQQMNGPIRLKCLEKNSPAIFFYKKHGFIELEKGMSTEGIYILMEKISD